MKSISIIEGQTIFDIAVQEYRTVEGVFYLMEDNPSLVPDMDTVLQEGSVLVIREELKVPDTVVFPIINNPLSNIKKVITQDGDSVFTLGLNHYGSAEGVFSLMEDNPELIPNLDVEIEAGMVLSIDTSKKINTAASSMIAKKPLVDTALKVIVTEGQNVYDVAVQCYGSAEGVFALLEDNPDVIFNLDAFLYPGTVLVVNESKVMNKEVIKYYKDRGVRVNSGTALIGGVEFWGIEFDFIIE